MYEETMMFDDVSLRLRSSLVHIVTDGTRVMHRIIGNLLYQLQCTPRIEITRKRNSRKIAESNDNKVIPTTGFISGIRLNGADKIEEKQKGRQFFL